MGVILLCMFGSIWWATGLMLLNSPSSICVEGLASGMDINCPLEMIKLLHEILKDPRFNQSIDKSLFMWKAKH